MQLAACLFIALAAVLAQEAVGSTCPYTCTVSYTYQSGDYECGSWWSRRRCPQYRTGYRSSTCYKSCTHGEWSSYSELSRTACTRSCGGGTQLVTKMRTCTNPAPANGGNPCYGSSTMTTTESCNTHHCPVHGGWSEFRETSRSGCSKSCGGGQITIQQERECANPPPAYSGNSCQGTTAQTVYEDCNTHPCPIDGGWTEFSDWLDYDECTVLCGGGKKDQFHTRTCTNPPPQYGGENCVGAVLENRTIDCNTENCDSCPEGQLGYMAHPTNKRRFYQCDNGVARRHDCAPGSKFDISVRVCVTDEEQAPTTAAPITHAPRSDSACSGGAQFVAHESDCNKYYQCANGQKILRSCAPGLHFDTSINTCNHASLAGCL